MVKRKIIDKKSRKKSTRKNPVDLDDMLRKDFPRITASELKRLKVDESYKEGFLLAISLVFSELKTIVDGNE
jgi:hypothetical protein